MSRPMNANLASLAPYACHPSRSRGRLHDEPAAADRDVFQRDRDRIIHSGAFRKLKYKTQVFVYHEGDYFRTRLTHSLEVSQISRSIARALNINEDLAEAVALAHDLGHPPFGHAGESALDNAAASYGGFDHNVQTLRTLTRLEQRYADFDGLNLTWETLEGTVKHNGPLSGPHADPEKTPDGVPTGIQDFDRQFSLDLDGFASLEAQVAALADDIAYNNHDLDDGLRAGLFTLDDLMDLPPVGPVLRQVRETYGDIEPSRLIHEMVRRVINLMVTDVLAETRRRLDEAKPDSADAVRAQPRPMVAFSERMAADNDILRRFLFTRMYRHYKVNRMTSKARRTVADLFALLLDQPNCLPDEWQAAVDPSNVDRLARVVCDYIAGMTDRYALLEHDRLFDIHHRAE
ncbi:MAG: deoxyguanosinetriphosphate triphosphohydrolase [Alphaproteobacteria bacterium]|nr:deoxyguanosinetriphosphate triphosphohydrolase [Alphaproteobacteria bacterium]